ncbi:polysaccharide biosynthesis tyrosine autokinase [Dictyobacter arantiisoli]|uniref:CobQ/CobB/MinD/ParA nucleotide binding domain-containing protein n=1 Tax=Dictyobacter arantiisoli TaxID=2014874 RepID=A0A5A5T5V8_9CHLR|nr:polysaccharide biosynthesis tyrosine autokinase [Dictyobacter arantiisoli]GCF06820.1 hypothetical protein KDI_03840 [Dictyobacter arantiisoli]
MSLHATLRHYAWVIRHHSIQILSCITLCTSLTYVVSVYLPPTYQASILVKVTPLSTNTGDSSTNVQIQTADYAQLVTSPDVLQAATKTVSRTSVDQLNGAISSSPIDQTQFLMIYARGNSIHQALERVNAVANSFIHIQITKEGTQLQVTLAHISQEITNTRQQLAIHSKQTATTQQKSSLDSEQSHYSQLQLEYNQLQFENLHVPELLSLPRAASATQQPIAPDIQHNTLLAAAISLALTLLLTLLWDWLHTAIQTAEDIYQQVDLASLGQIPYRRSLTQGAQLLDFSLEKLEDIRTAYTVMGIRFQVLHKGQSALLCTSLQRKSGTTTTASQLAVHLTQTGMRVLLVDMHIQQPALHTIFNLPDTYGLTTSLSDVRHFDKQPALYPAAWLAQWKTYLPNLWLLPCGPTCVEPDLPASNLISDLVQLKEWLLGQHNSDSYSSLPQLIDLIIFDAGPLDTGSMTHMLTTVADASLLTIAANTTQPEELQHASQTLQQLETPVIGTVLTKHKSRHRSYFYVKKQQRQQTEIQGTLPETSQMLADHISLPPMELPETPPPWHNSSLSITSVQTRLTLPTAQNTTAHQFQSLMSREVPEPEEPTTGEYIHTERAEHATLRIPSMQLEEETLEDDETVRNFQTSLELPIMKKLPTHTSHTARTRGSSLQQFKQTYTGEHSREQLT